MYITENKTSDPDSTFAAEEFSTPGKSFFSSPLEVLSDFSYLRKTEHLRGISSPLSVTIFYEEYNFFFDPPKRPLGARNTCGLL